MTNRKQVNETFAVRRKTRKGYRKAGPRTIKRQIEAADRIAMRLDSFPIVLSHTIMRVGEKKLCEPCKKMSNNILSRDFD